MDVCRTCLAADVSKDILELPKGIEEESKTSSEIMQFSVNIEIGPNQNISTKLCENCFFKIIDIYKFKDQALRNQDYLTLCSKTKPNHEVNSFDCLDDKLNNFDRAPKIEIKKEINVKEESECGGYESDDTLLSVIKNIKYEYVSEDAKENLPTLPAKKKRGRRKTVIIKRNKATKEVCSVCGKSVRNIKVHMTLHASASERKKYPCEYCSKVFSGYSARYKHMNIKHLGIKSQCHICKKDVVDLKTHTLTVHDSSRLPFECNICNRRFISKTKLGQHMVTHTKVKPFFCDICQKGFSTAHLMSRHKRQVHDKEKEHLCQICSKSFFKKYSLQVHLRSHSKEKPYSCAECGKWFSSCSTLKAHALLHAATKPYACQHCDMTFASPKYVYRHAVVHTKEKKYPCKYCGVLFGRSDHKNRHQRTAHENHFNGAVKITD